MYPMQVDVIIGMIFLLPIYSITSYGNSMFHFTPLSQEHNQGKHQGPAQASGQDDARKRIAPTRNLQNMKDKHANQPTKNRATPYHIHVLPRTAMVGHN
jgi:hypothetical protein